MKLSARASLVNYDNGELYSASGLSLCNTTTHDRWIKLVFGNKHINSGRTDNPLNAHKKTKLISKENGDFIQFGHSNLKTDSGQTAVPFWDIQTVAPEPAVPLMGVGFVWKSVDNSGGFVAPVVLSPDYSFLIADIELDIMDLMIKNYAKKWKSFDGKDDNDLDVNVEDMSESSLLNNMLKIHHDELKNIGK